MTARSLRGSSQMRQRGSSARLKHTSHSPTFSRTSRIASARAIASESGARRMWKASRWAVRCPTPGSFASSPISRWIGPAYMACLGLETRQTHAAEPAGDPTEPVRGQLLSGADRLVDGGEHHLRKHLDVLRVGCARIDRDLEEAQVAAHLHLDHPAAGARLDDLVLELLLLGGHVRLHLLELLHHRIQVEPAGPLRSPGHPVASFGSASVASLVTSISLASNSDLKRSMSSSGERISTSVAASSSSGSSSTNTGRRRLPIAARRASAS